MRVQATEASPSYSMGKNKKLKIRKTKEASDSSDDGSIPTCNHVNMSVNFAQMKKGLSKHTFGECASCTKDLTSRRTERSSDGSVAGATSREENSLLGDSEPTMWVCLQCGHQGCDRNSYDKHALKHYETPRSSCHCIVINTSSWSTWCYKCDDNVPIEKNKKLVECLEYLRKQSGLPNVESAKRSSSHGATASSSVDQIKETSNRPLTPRGPAQGLCHKLKGLSNLGNTCFFNAVMQNLTQTQSLESVILDRSKKGRSLQIDGKQLSDSDESSDDDDDDSGSDKELPPIEIVMPEAGPLTQSMVSFLHEMNNSSNRSSTVNPSALFSQVCKKAQRFRGFQQQDSHELLRYLTDSMKMEEIKRGQAAILKHFKVPENCNPKKVPEDTKYKIKEYGRHVKHTFVDSLFGGHLLSTVMCEECKHISQIFEPFLDLSLPVTEEKPQRPNQVQAARKKEIAENAEDNNSAYNEDGKVYKPVKQSKQELKRQKRQAKKDAKQKKKKVSRNKVTPGGTEQEVEGDQGEPEGDDDEEDNEEEDKKSEDQKSGELDENSSNKDDDNSDADIEDNLESDISRCNTFGVLNMMNNSKDMSDSLGSSQDTSKISDSPLNSSTSTLQADSLSSNVTDVNSTGSTQTLNEVPDSVSFTMGENGKTEPSIENGKTEPATENGNTQLTDDKEFLKPKLIANATIDDMGNEMVNGFCNEEVNGDETFSRLNGIEEDPKPNLCDNKNIGNNENDCAKSATLVNGDIGRNSSDSSISSKLEKLTISENGALNGNELTSKLENLTVNDSNLLNGPSLHNNKLEKSEIEYKEDENQEEIEEDRINKMKRNSNVSPPLSRQGSGRCSKKDLKKEAQMKSTTMLGPHYIPSSRECSVMSCLHQFTSAELLTGNNKFGCANCTRIRDKQHKGKKETVYSNASKYYLIYSPPAVLTLHMKRFEQVGFTSRKVNRHVDFPFVLDLAPFCSSLCQGIKPGQKKILYALYGVVEHSGRLNAGHYTAYVKVRPNIGMNSNFFTQSPPSFKDYIQRYTDDIAKGQAEDTEVMDDVHEEKLVPPGRWYHISDSRVSEATESTVQRAQAYLLFYERIY